MLIVQLSDPHLSPRGARYQGLVDANAMFAAAVDQVNAMVPQPDLMVLTGDVVDHGGAADYAEAAALLGRLHAPLLLIPGNHDERGAFRAALGSIAPWPATGPLHSVADRHGPVRVIGFDVTVPGAHHGLVDAAAADWLAAALAVEPGRPTIVAMHQPPFACGIPYVDPYRCFGEDRLASVIGGCPAVEAVLCGHVHRMMLRRFAGTLLCTAPSTTTAIALRLTADADPASFVEPPAFLLHHWRRGGLVTHLVPIGSFQGPLPFA